MQNRTLLLVLLIITGVTVVNSSDLFASLDKLKALSQAEEEIVPDLEDAIKALQDKILLMRSVLADLKRSHVKSDPENALSMAGHPIHAYNLIKRWHHIDTLFNVQDTVVADESDQQAANKLPIDPNCSDNHEHCKFWANTGECEKNPGYMLHSCKISCKVCTLPPKDARDKNMDELLLKIRSKTRSGVDLGDEDYQGAAQGIIRLQRTYALNTRQLKEGNISGHKSIEVMSNSDCFNLGKAAIDMGEWGYGLQWLEMTDMKVVGAFHRAHIHGLKAEAYIGIGDYSKANESLMAGFDGNVPDLDSDLCVDRHESCKEWAQLDECEKNPQFMLHSCMFSCHVCEERRPEQYPAEYFLINVYYNLTKILSTRGENHANQEEEQASEENKTSAPTTPVLNAESARVPTYDAKPIYEGLCRGEGMIWYPDAVCRWRGAPSPWNVYKEEILSMDPRISLIYDVINDEEAKMIRDNAQKDLIRSQVGSDARKTMVRVSMTRFLSDRELPQLRRISERVEMITGLEVTDTVQKEDGSMILSSDDFQVVNYGIAGQYEPHHDYFSDGKLEHEETDIGKLIQNSGDRIATFLLYLTAIEAGGGTVYPEVGILVPPIKNAAAFWYNAKLNGEYDARTLHAGCPVLLGEKWVCNRWVREYGNQFNRQCALDKDAKYS